MSTAIADDVPTVLLPYQLRWIQDGSALKVIEKSRRTGLTWAEAADDVAIAASARTAGGMNVYYIGYNMDMAIEFIEACAMWARALHGLVASIEEGEEVFKEGNEEKSIRTYTIRFASGFRIVALSSRPANLRGKQGVVVIDEAAFHGELDELLKAALALLIWGGKVRIISTHNGDSNTFNQLIQDIRAGRRAGSVHRISFLDAILEGLFRRVCLRQGKEWTQETEDAWKAAVYKFYGDAATEELDVVPSQGSGAWLTAALIESRMHDVPVLRFTARDGFEQQPAAVRESEVQAWLESEVQPHLDLMTPMLMSMFGLDPARISDVWQLSVCQMLPNLTRSMPFAIELRKMPYRQQEQVLNFVVKRMPRFVKGAIDSGGNGGPLAEFAAQSFGFGRVELITFSEKWYREEMPPLKAAFEDGTILVPRDADTLNDLRAVKVINGVARIPDQRSQGSDGGKRHGDAAVGIALMYYASRHPGAEIDWTPMPIHPRGFDNLVDNPNRRDGIMRGNTDLEISIPEPRAW